MVRAISSTRGACPDAAELAAFFEGTLSDSQRPGVVSHVASCAECRAALGALGRMPAAVPPVVPAELREAAVAPLSRQRWRSAAVALAAAACVLFAVSIARQDPEQASGVVTVPGAAPSVVPDDVRARATRLAPQLLEPQAGQMLSSSTRFEWTPVAGAVQYQLHVLTGDGEVVFDAMTTETGIVYAGAGTQQGPFYAWVSARLTDGRRVQSAVVRLTGPVR